MVVPHRSPRETAARAHYIVRVGNEGLAPRISLQAPNHWHYLAPQQLWGFPKTMNVVKVRAKFEEDVKDLHVTTYIWFLCNGHGGAGRFVQVGIGERLSGGPVNNGPRPIPGDVFTRLQQGFDHWFEWRPVSLDEAFQDRVRKVPIPHPPYLPSLRRVTEEHPSFSRFQALIDNEDDQALTAATTAAASASAARTRAPAAAVEEVDIKNIQREQANPHAQGSVYLIHMEGTAFYKIGMSLDPEIRLRTLQTGNPHPLSLITTSPVQDMRDAELSLHHRFETQRVPNPNVREWFDFGTGTARVQSVFSSIR